MADLPGYDHAINQTLSGVSALPSESCPLDWVAKRILRQNVAADRDQPPFDRAAMDGFALRAASWRTNKAFRVAGDVPAGGRLSEDTAIDPTVDVVRIATGAAVPDVFDAVIQIEKAQVGGDPPTVVFDLDAAAPGLNIHRRGADAATGNVVLRAPAVLAPHHLGIAAAVGASRLTVARQPRAVVLSSGDEVKPADTPTPELEPQHIRNSNGPLLVALLRATGAEVLRHEHVVDEAGPVQEACARAAADADLVVTAGGVSVGRRDLFPTVWPDLGYETVLHGVKMQPGKPVFVARPTSSEGALVLGLPGNPVSVWATAHLFVWPAVRKALGLDPGLPWRRVVLASPAKANPRREAFRAARFVGQGEQRVEVVAWQGSGDLMHTAVADGLLRLPAQEGRVEAQTELWFLPVLGGGS